MLAEICPECDRPMICFGPDETGMLTYVCPTGQTVKFKRRDKTFVVGLVVASYYDEQRKKHYDEHQQHDALSEALGRNHIRY